MKRLFLLLSFMLFVMMPPALAQDNTLDSTLDPNFDTVALGPGMTPDPYIATVTSGGTVEVASLDLGPGCTGFATSAPDYRIQWAGPTPLRVFFVGEGDATLVVNTADGQWMCSDDASGTPNPMVDVPDAPAGQYDIWIGSYSATDAISGYLMVTENDSYPGHIVSPVLGEVVLPETTIETEALPLDISVDTQPNFGSVTLEPGFTPDPHTVSLVSGGDVDASTLNLGSDCQGFVTDTPDYHVDLADAASRLRIFFVGEGDATLIVSTPDGEWVCNDDASGTNNPMVELTDAPAGPYDIWVGSFQSGRAIAGTLYVTELDYDPSDFPPA